MKRSLIFRRILRLLKPYAGYFVLTVFAAMVSVAAQLLVPFLVGECVDVIVGQNNVNFHALYPLLCGVGGCVVAAVVSQYVVSLANNRIAYCVLADVRRDTFEKLGRLPLKYIDDRPYGDISAVIVADSEQFADGLLLGFTQLFTGVCTILGVLVIMFVLRWEIALIVFFLTPLSLLIARFISKRTYTTFKRQAEVRAEQTAFIDEMVENLKVVKAFTHEEENEATFAEQNERLRRASLRAVFFSSTVNPSTRFVNSVVYSSVALSGALIVIATGGAFSVGALTSFLSYATQYTKPFNEITEVIAEFQNALACAGRIFALLDEKEQPTDAAFPGLGRAEGEVKAEHVRFAYDPARPLFENLNLTAEAGKHIAIVGPTGCGKTTLINLLMRFYDVDGGRILVDGKDVRAITRKSLRKNYGMVLQDTWLKEATVRENLCMGAENCTEEEMIAAAKAAHAHGFIMRLPNGYDTVVGGTGTLSEGQRQLLCIARVMLCRPPMLILDEATSSIDTRTELLVQDAFSKLMEGRTCFIIAHRLSTIKNADRILVMGEGKILEEGTHAELLKRGGAYAKLYHAQFEE